MLSGSRKPNKGAERPNSALEGRIELILNSDGSAKPVIENVLRVIEGDPGLSGFHFDDFGKRVVVTDRLPWSDEEDGGLPREWDGGDDEGLAWYVGRFYGIMSRSVVRDGFSLALLGRKTHPVREYFNSLKWDGTPRLDKLLIDYWGADDNAYTREAARKQIVASVARIFNPGTKKDEMLILVGKRGTGKNAFIRTLAKSRAGENDWFSDSVKGFGRKRKDFVEIQGKLLVELDGPCGLSKRDLGQIKRFLSKRGDDFRPPHGKRVSGHPRQCVFWGTANESELLDGGADNRRFWPIRTHPEKAVKDVWRDLPGEVDQVWAEAVARYRDGEVLTLSAEAEAIAKREQNPRLREDPAGRPREE